MERETKREKREIFAWEVAQGERRKVWVFFEVYRLTHKLRRICDTNQGEFVTQIKEIL